MKPNDNSFPLTFLFLLIGFIWSACSKEQSSADITPEADKQPDIVSIELSAYDSLSIVGNNTPVRLSIKPFTDRGKPLYGLSHETFLNGRSIGNSFTVLPERAVINSVYVNINGINSNEIYITAREPEPLPEIELKLIFHIVHDGESPGQGMNIPYGNVVNWVEEANKILTNNDLTPNSFAPNIRFKLAESDPDGNALEEPGVKRVLRPNKNATIFFEDWMWNHYWDPDDYINIWVGETGNNAHWGTYPVTDCSPDTVSGLYHCFEGNQLPYITGIALIYNRLEPGYLLHELGHMLGLFHTFSNGGCGKDMDYCLDTPQYDREASDPYQVYRTNCYKGFLFNSYNPMDYYYGDEMDFSYDQCSRMHHVLKNGLFIGTDRFEESTLPSGNTQELRKHWINIEPQRVNCSL